MRECWENVPGWQYSGSEGWRVLTVKKKQQETAVENRKPEKWFLIGNFIFSRRCFAFFHSLLNLSCISYQVTMAPIVERMP